MQYIAASAYSCWSYSCIASLKGLHAIRKSKDPVLSAILGSSSDIKLRSLTSITKTLKGETIQMR